MGGLCLCQLIMKAGLIGVEDTVHDQHPSVFEKERCLQTIWRGPKCGGDTQPRKESEESIYSATKVSIATIIFAILAERGQFRGIKRLDAYPEAQSIRHRHSHRRGVLKIMFES